MDIKRLLKAVLLAIGTVGGVIFGVLGVIWLTERFPYSIIMIILLIMVVILTLFFYD
jgi:hypothetical protein